MRLIDADALMRDMGVSDAIKYGNKTAEQQHNSYSTLMKYEIADYIEDATTIEAEPVRHGRWLMITDSKHCGVCSVCFRQDFIDPLATHCRYCGAKMDLEGNHEKGL